MDALKSILTNLIKRTVNTEDIESALKPLCREIVNFKIADRASVILNNLEKAQQFTRFVEDKIPGAPPDAFELPQIEQLRNCDEPIIYEDKNGVVKTRLAVRISAHNRFLGILSLSSRTLRKFSTTAIQTIKEIASVLAIMLENRILLMDIPLPLCRTHLPGLLALNRLRNKVMEEINRVDRYGGVFSILILSPSPSGKPPALSNGEALNSLKAFINENVRQTDFVSLSHDTVAVVMPNTSASGATAAAKRLRKLVKDNWGLEQGFLLEPFFGISTYPQDSPFATTLIEAAEIALNRAINQHRPPIENYSSLSH
ncbi:MAG: GGDEF domain-containing protein [Planctomycetota bacterium]|nr:GGDEF domain-containing protein [Planctomycetota bacterium]